MLSDTTTRGLKPANRAQRNSDRGGLYLDAFTQGGHCRHPTCRHHGKQQTLAHGIGPEIGTKQARDRCAEDTNQNAVRQARRPSSRTATAHNLEVIAREWLTKPAEAREPRDHERVTQRPAANAFRRLDEIPMRHIEPPTAPDVPRRIAQPTPETALRCSQRLSQVLHHAIATRQADRDPTPDLRGAITRKRIPHLPAPTDPKWVSELLTMIDGHTGRHVVGATVRMAPRAVVRPGALPTTARTGLQPNGTPAPANGSDAALGGLSGSIGSMTSGVESLSL